MTGVLEGAAPERSGTLSEAAGAGGVGASEEEAVPLGSAPDSLVTGRGAGAAAVLADALPLLLSVRVHGPAKAAKPPRLTASPPASSFHRIQNMTRCSSLNFQVTPAGYPPAATAPVITTTPSIPSPRPSVSANSRWLTR